MCADWRSSNSTPWSKQGKTRRAENGEHGAQFEGLFGKTVVSKFDSQQRTSDGGATLLAVVDRRIGLTERLSALLHDPREASRVEHTYQDLVRQRVFSIALDYPDGHDSARIGHDPAIKLLCGRRPSDARSLASQPTLSRFEHGLSGRDVVSLGRELEGSVIDRLRGALDELGVEYIVAMGGNSVLASRSKRHMHAARELARRFEKTTALFGEARYKTKSWKHERRVIFKAEVVHAAGKSPRNNARYVVTNLRHDPERVWELYCLRGDSENRIKELKRDLEIDRTSCSSFLANQVRVLLTAAAYVLYQELRAVLRGTELHRAMVATLRLRLLRIGATITESVRRIVISMSSSHPWKDLWTKAAERALALG
ncbi:MAG TPA: hypothetical protein ENJ09_03215 [Planctomycetes bacterium]|nr:hypothetical protein [Planctomycetota bacterium]